MRTIGFRLGLLIFGSLFLIVAAGLGVIYTLHITDRTIDRALDAQHRLDLLTEMSGRIQQYGLVAISTVDDANLRATRLKEAEAGVGLAIKNFEPELGKAISQADLQLDINAMTARVKPLEQVRAGFRVLVRQVDYALAQPDQQQRGDLIRGAFNGFATMTGPYLFFLMQADRRGVEASRDQARAVSTMITRAALGFLAIALVGALVMHRLISRPILAAVVEIRDAAIAIGQGERNLRLPVRNRDELGLLAVVFNRMTARLRRGEQRVASDQAMLEKTIEDRTHDLRAVNDKLAAIDRSRRRFFADVSHELRTPLTVILGECEIALKPSAPEPPAKTETDAAAFTVIQRRAQRLQRRVEDMLRVARSESGTLELRSDRVALRAVCGSAIDAFEGATKRKDVAIRLEPSGDEAAVFGDFEWLRQIVEGMIDNALRYAKGATTIAVAVGREGDRAMLTVRDDGPGFGVDDPNRLLERFTRNEASEARLGTIDTMSGHGIGLSLVRWVVDKHGGTVRLGTADPPLGGAEILITLPLASP
jgi:two-component system OmpR family sensor kinase